MKLKETLIKKRLRTSACVLNERARWLWWPVRIELRQLRLGISDVDFVITLRQLFSKEGKSARDVVQSTQVLWVMKTAFVLFEMLLSPALSDVSSLLTSTHKPGSREL
jgi:hypothetical protein